MKLAIHVIVSLVLIGYFTLAHAKDDRWKYIATNGLDQKIYYDTKSVTVYGKKEDKIAKVWIKSIATKSEDNLQESSELREYDCSNRMTRSLPAGKFVRKDGTENHLDTTNTIAGEWSEISYDTWHETIFDIVCKKK